MKELKFRAWDKVDKKVRKVMSLDFYNTRQWEVTLVSDGDVYLRYFEQIELMQSTGLKDKNGVEIFEGDILCILQMGVISNGFEAHYENKRVLFDEGSFCIENYAKSENFDMENHYEIRLYHKPDELEVIGNIYENPELLEVE